MTEAKAKGDPSLTSGYVSHLECSASGERIPHDHLHGLSRAGAPLLVRYDLDAIGRDLDKRDLAARPTDMWRLRELLPCCGLDTLVSLGEAATPLVPVEHPGVKPGCLLFKDEGRLPTGSFKARGMALAVTMAKHFGKTRLAVPTAGNAGAAAAAYGACAGLETFVFLPEDTPEVTQREIGYHGARAYRVDGLINACAEIVRRGTAEMGWHDLSTLAEPYRLEGKKTMGLELAEQLGWTLPDVIYYPTGGGTGFIGMWKAFAELEAIGWIGPERPRMVAVQTDGCAPIVRAYEHGQDHVASPWDPVETEVHGVRVPKPLGDRLILQAIRESDGFAAAVSDREARDARSTLARDKGLHVSPEGAICYATYLQDLDAGRVTSEQRVVLFNTATGFKSPMPPAGSYLDRSKPIDYQSL